MGLCAPNYQKPMWNFVKNCWHIGNTPLPNWSPDEVKFKKERKKMLDEDQKKVVVDQLTEKKNQLERKLGSFTEQAAAVGKKLHDTLFELENVTDVLDEMIGKKDEYEE